MNRARVIIGVIGALAVLAVAPRPGGAQQESWVVSSPQAIGSVEHQLSVARRIMDLPRNHRFGPWRLLAEDTLAARTRKPLQAVAASLPASYAQRLKLEPQVGDAWFLLFSREHDYRKFRSQFGGGLTGATEGHATDGLAATFLGNHTRDHVAALVVHEGVHLLNRSTFGDRLPMWLDEGLATSLSYNRIDGRGRLLLGTVSSRSLSTSRSEQLADGRRKTTHQIRLEGPMAALLAYSERPQDWPPLSSLVGSWSRHDGERTQMLYPQAGFLVRFLLDGADRDTQLAFRALLTELATRPRPELVSALENRMPELEPTFRKWLHGLARQSLAQIRPTGPSPHLGR